MTTRLINMTLEVTEIEIGKLLEHFGTRSGVTIHGLESPVAGQVAAQNETVVTTTTVPAAGSDVNEKGVPWSEEFHASTKTINKDGSWKARKGVDKDALKNYEAQFTSQPITTPDTTPAITQTPEARVDPNIAETMPDLPPFLDRTQNPPGGVSPVAEQTPTVPGVPPVAEQPPAIPTANVAPPAPRPITYDELSSRFAEVTNVIGADTLMANLGAIYQASGVDAEGTVLQSNETARRSVFDAISGLANLSNA